MPEGDKLRKFKGRTVFQENNVRDENSDVALFSELGSSPATMEALLRPLTHTGPSLVTEPSKTTGSRPTPRLSCRVSKHGSNYFLTGGQRNGEANSSGSVAANRPVRAPRFGGLMGAIL